MATISPVPHKDHRVARTFSEKAISTVTGLSSGKIAMAVEKRVETALKESRNPFAEVLGSVAEYVTAVSVGASVDAGLGSVVDHFRGDKVDAKSIERRAFSGAAIGLVGRFLNPVKATKVLPPLPVGRK